MSLRAELQSMRYPFEMAPTTLPFHQWRRFNRRQFRGKGRIHSPLCPSKLLIVASPPLNRSRLTIRWWIDRTGVLMMEID